MKRREKAAKSQKNKKKKGKRVECIIFFRRGNPLDGTYKAHIEIQTGMLTTRNLATKGRCCKKLCVAD
jgi:hypothetical protein